MVKKKNGSPPAFHQTLNYLQVTCDCAETIKKNHKEMATEPNAFKR